MHSENLNTEIITRHTSGNTSLRLLVNAGLLLMAIAVAFSGFLLQAGYHMGGHGSIDTDTVYMGLNYFGWSALHRITIIAITALFVIHVYLHMNWYKSVLSGKNTKRSLQVMVLTLIFILVALSGYISWFIHIFNGSEMVRKLFIELHDKLTILLFIFLFMHIAGRFSWFRKALGRRNPDRTR